MWGTQAQRGVALCVWLSPPRAFIGVGRVHRAPARTLFTVLPKSADSPHDSLNHLSEPPKLETFHLFPFHLFLIYLQEN